MPDPSFEECPVCAAPAPRPLLEVEGRRYLACDTCSARLLHPRDRLPAAQADAHYLLHRNEVGDPGYRRFLSKVAGPLLERLAPGSRGIDYGCGRGPALAAVLREAGHHVRLYDPLFHPDEAALAERYDFATCTEVAEHFLEPAREFDRLVRLLGPGGWLAVMTCFQTDDAKFAAWHYRRDPTHVVFYREETLRLVAERRGLGFESPAKDVALMRRPGTTPA